MNNMFERAFVVSADYARDDDGELQGVERGDDVIVIATREHNYHLHLRRGMTAEDIADGLEAYATAIRKDANG